MRQHVEEVACCAGLHEEMPDHVRVRQRLPQVEHAAERVEPAAAEIATLVTTSVSTCLTDGSIGRTSVAAEATQGPKAYTLAPNALTRHADNDNFISVHLFRAYL